MSVAMHSANVSQDSCWEGAGVQGRLGEVPQVSCVVEVAGEGTYVARAGDRGDRLR